MTLKEKILSDNYLEDYENPITDYQADIIVQRADNYAIEFAEWADDNYFRMGRTNLWGESTDWENNIKITTKELLEIFKKEKEWI